ncbi:phospholipid phosphatase-related protein type 5-like isoform X2 [Myripristis murdjan]|uniref:phospholipid phosphatase-related protein type 5-like isoform X2 n=1 Tax=Myripristis murdjan TaxID=586833 RepID=UPI0011764742|nr:phospholipid phosphatase-related protein type 5-like isoform X2 [Myripristis murdjan]
MRLCFLKILIGEVTSFFVKTEGAQEKTIVTADCCYFNPLLRRIVRFLGQVVTGNQTPHFLSACKPNYTALGCQSPLQYITERRACTGNPYLVASARKSFPSKDAALSFYSAIYTVMYVTLVFRTKGTRLTKPTLCLVLLSLAVLVGVVRVTEHRNHWNDVLAGFLTGGAIAAFLVTCVINNFQPTKIAAPVLPPQRPEPPIALPLLSLPRVESPLEKLQGYRILRSHDHQPIRSPAPPDVLLPSRRCLTSAV